MKFEELTKDQRDKLTYAVAMLEENLGKTKQYEDRSAGITNGDCELVVEGRRKFLERMRKEDSVHG